MRSHAAHPTHPAHPAHAPDPTRTGITSHESKETKATKAARLEFSAQPAGAAYFVDETGTRWRIYDCIVRRGRLERVYLESDAATYRVFVAPDGTQEAYHRGRREAFCLSAGACVRQLRQAQVIRSAMKLIL